MSFLQKKIFDLFPSSFGLDLSDLSIKVLRMESEGKLHRVSGYTSAALPVGSVIDGEILKPEIVIDVMRKLMENQLLGTDGAISWDGILDDTSKARMGAYIVLFEVFDLDGNTELFKKTVAVA